MKVLAARSFAIAQDKVTAIAQDKIYYPIETNVNANVSVFPASG